MNYWKRMIHDSLRLYFLPLAVAYRAIKAKLTMADRVHDRAKVPGSANTD